MLKQRKTNQTCLSIRTTLTNTAKHSETIEYQRAGTREKIYRIFTREQSPDIDRRKGAMWFKILQRPQRAL